MNRQQANKIIKRIYRSVRPQSAIQVLKKDKELVQFLNSLHPDLESHSLCEKCYWILNDIYQFPLCKLCNKKLLYSFSNIKEGYRPYCSRKCASNSEESKKAFQKTMIELYGVSNPAYSKELMDKAKHTMINRYGVEYACQSNFFLQKSKQVYLKHYNVDHPLKSDEVKQKMINTCLDKYGVSSVFSLDSVRKKSRQTCLERYGFEFPIQNPEIKNKVKETIIQRYDSWNNYIHIIEDKYKNTCLDRYGVDHPSKLKEIQDKYKNTCLDRYSVDCVFHNPEVIKKIQQTNIRRYGCINPTKNPEVIKKIRKTSNSKESKLKRILTNRLRFGYDYPQCDPNREFLFKKIFYKNIWFDSSWEILFYDFLLNNDIAFIYHPKHFFDYIFENIKHKYYPDFYLIEYHQFIELKGDHFFTNDGKMINPYDRSQDNIYEAKHQCMIKNNVKIFKEKDLVELDIDLSKCETINRLYILNHD